MITLGPKVAFAAAIAMSVLLVGPAGAQTASQSDTIVVTAPETPFGQALAGQFGSRGAEAGIRSFYESNAYQPLWLSKKGKSTKAAKALIAWAKNADTHGLPTARYATEALSEKLESARSGDPAGAAALEMALTRLFLTYGTDLNSGLVKSGLFSLLITSICCYFGLSTEGGSVGLGRNIMIAVVTSLVAIITVDAVATGWINNYIL